MMWRTAGALQSVLSPPPLHSLLPSLPLLLLKKKSEGPFYNRNISGEEFIFYYIFKLNQKIAAGENYRRYSYKLIPKQ